MNTEKGLVLGSLYIVATPIGNKNDLSSRAKEILIACDRVAAEDTRRATRLLAELGENQHKLISLHEHNEDQLVGFLVGELVNGATVALVSDSGTPLLSDPGYRLVQAASSSGITVIPIPGPSSIVAALSVCPLPAHPFLFVGFLLYIISGRSTLRIARKGERKLLDQKDQDQSVVNTVMDLFDTMLG